MAGLSSVLLALTLVLDCAMPATALQQLLPTSVAANRLAPRVSQPHLFMRSRYEDGEDRRLSQGGSGGRWGKQAKPRALGISRFGEGDNDIRRKKLEAYVNSEEDAADPLIGKIIAGSLLLTIFGLLFAVYAYYGADGLSAATYSQRAIRGM